MTEQQKDIIRKLAMTLFELSNECHCDSTFFDKMAKIGETTELIPLSLDEMASEWLSIAREEVKK